MNLRIYLNAAVYNQMPSSIMEEWIQQTDLSWSTLLIIRDFNSVTTTTVYLILYLDGSTDLHTTVPVTNSADAIQNFSLEETGLEVRYKQVLIIVQG